MRSANQLTRLLCLILGNDALNRHATLRQRPGSLSETEVSASGPISQLLMVEPKQVHHCSVNILNVDFVFHSGTTDFVS